MRTPPLLADFIHSSDCKLICEKSLTLPSNSGFDGFKVKPNDSALFESKEGAAISASKSPQKRSIRR